MKRIYELTIIGLGFLSVLPVQGRVEADEEKLGESTVLFPVCGLVIGGLTAGANLLFALFLPPSLSDILTLLFLFMITGGLHTDGLADTFDGILSGKGPESVRRIMKDSRIGVHGSAMLFFVLMLKYLSLQAILPEKKALVIVLMVMAGRWSVVVVGYMARAVSEDGGLGSMFTENVTGRHLVKASVLFIPLSFFFGGFSGAISAILLVIAVSVVVTRIAFSVAGRVSGDTFGAVIEISETVVLLSSTLSFNFFE